MKSIDSHSGCYERPNSRLEEEENGPSKDFQSWKSDFLLQFHLHWQKLCFLIQGLIEPPEDKQFMIILLVRRGKVKTKRSRHLFKFHLCCEHFGSFAMPHSHTCSSDKGSSICSNRILIRNHFAFVNRLSKSEASFQLILLIRTFLKHV